MVTIVIVVHDIPRYGFVTMAVNKEADKEAGKEVNKNRWQVV